MRIDDVDTPRITRESIPDILRTLESFHLYWDGEVVYQSRRQQRYDEALQRLIDLDVVFPCACSRRKLPDGPYPGTCRNGLPAGKQGRSIRFKVNDGITGFIDGLQGEYQQNLANDVGDFIIHRGDDITSYHLSVVIDDADAGITDIVRGVDLIASTPRQIALQIQLGIQQPDYMHLPVATDRSGTKLSKQTHAKPVTDFPVQQVMFDALEFLQQRPESSLRSESVEVMLEWAIRNWDISRLSNCTQLEAPVAYAADTRPGTTSR